MDIKKSLGIMESLEDRKMKFSYEEYISQTEKRKILGIIRMKNIKNSFQTCDINTFIQVVSLLK